jgi:hypothetical protein
MAAHLAPAPRYGLQTHPVSEKHESTYSVSRSEWRSLRMIDLLGFSMGDNQAAGKEQECVVIVLGRWRRTVQVASR